MNDTNLLACTVSTSAPAWGMVNLFIWKIVPDKFGGGKGYIQRYKDAWVIHNKSIIRMASARYHLPVELLAGVCWIEVGGDPNFVDRIAFEIRALDWSGPGYIDNNMTMTKPPAKTSFGSVSMQLSTAANALGLDAAHMNIAQLRALSNCLQHDTYNIELVARHLRELANYDHLPMNLRKEDVRIIGARYNRGIKPTLNEIKRNSSYGNFIVNHWQRFHKLIWESR